MTFFLKKIKIYMTIYKYIIIYVNARLICKYTQMQFQRRQVHIKIQNVYIAELMHYF